MSRGEEDPDGAKRDGIAAYPSVPSLWVCRYADCGGWGTAEILSVSIGWYVLIVGVFCLKPMPVKVFVDLVAWIDSDY